jgi:hypothetical protein
MLCRDRLGLIDRIGSANKVYGPDLAVLGSNRAGEGGALTLLVNLTEFRASRGAINLNY